MVSGRAAGGWVRPSRPVRAGTVRGRRSGIGLLPIVARTGLTGAPAFTERAWPQPDPGTTSQPRHRAIAATCDPRSSAWPCCPRWRAWSRSALLLMATSAASAYPAPGSRGSAARRRATDALAGELVIGLAVIIVAAGVVTLALLRYLLRPLGEMTDVALDTSRSLYNQAREDSPARRTHRSGQPARLPRGAGREIAAVDGAG